MMSREPKSLEYYVNRTIWNYPLSYRSSSYWASRVKVLNHLFFVIGNGLEWIDGRLADVCSDTSRKPFKAFPPGYFNEQFAVLYTRPPFPGSKIKFRPLNEFSEYEPCAQFYPISQYSRAFALPPEIRRDWYEGIRELVTLAKGYYTHEFQPKKVKPTATNHRITEDFRQRQLAWIRKIERRLKKVKVI